MTGHPGRHTNSARQMFAANERKSTGLLLHSKKQKHGENREVHKQARKDTIRSPTGQLLPCKTLDTDVEKSHKV